VRSVFADTFFWVAVTNPEDSRYRDAGAFDRVLAGTAVITTDEVLVEFLTFFSGGPWLRKRAAATVMSLFSDPAVRVIPQSRESFLAGLELYRSRPDKLQSYGLHFNADHARPRPEGGAHQ